MTVKERFISPNNYDNQLASTGLVSRELVLREDGNSTLTLIPLGSSNPNDVSAAEQFSHKVFEHVGKMSTSTAPVWQKRLEPDDDSNTNSTRVGISHKLLERLFKSLFASARDEIFEDGMESEFSKNLLFLIAISGDSDMAFDIMGDLILSEQVGFEVAAEALRWIGQIENSKTHEIRRILLEECLLESRSSRVKDAAGLGLAFLDDTKSIPALQKAISKEHVPTILQKTLGQVLEQLMDKAAQSGS